jgi:TetR/AcrR family transcriptional regulator
MEVREPQQQRGFARKAAVLEGAASVFEQFGYGQSSLKQITGASGATIGSIYFYYPTKESIALAVIQEQNARTFADFERIGAEHRGTEVLIRASRTVADALLTDVVVRAGIRLSLEQGTLSVPTAQFYRQWIDGLRMPLQEAVSAGEIDTPVPLDDVAQSLVPYFTGVHLVADVLTGRADLYARLRTMWQIVLHGIAAPQHQERLLGRVDDLFARAQPGPGDHPGRSV